METIKINFVPSFDISVTENELFEYYKEKNITTYPKKKNGMPIMKRNFNKKHIQLVHNKKSMLVEEQYEEYIKNGLEKKGKEIMQMKMDECKTCVICTNDMKSVSLLECGHTMCINCTISHFRVNNVCPFCRANVCERPTNRVMMENATLDALVTENLQSTHESRFSLSMNDYIRNRLIYYKTDGSGLNLRDITRSIVHEIKLSMFDLGASINVWYA
jgi:hypothetical protein